ncbi:hypothetical protein [Arthrobacter sp. HY1533]|uniref:hypothetical protein n=1 Tax=Arthrobacter sp. HY1533 TaxID=2970919 RepID=UPI0022B9DCA6|nr:hypothetical protein [Arthrobacter sp. HY1533]
MGKQGFDQRYPAMFQPGGEGHTEEPYEPGLLQAPMQAPMREPVPPAQAWPEAAPEGVQPEPPTEAPETSAEPQTRHLPLVPEPRWGARSWVLGLSAIGLTFAAAAFCLLAAALIPAAGSTDPSDFHGILMVPWGIAIAPGAPALFTAGLGMLAALFLVASRHYTGHAWWFHIAAAAVGLAALAGGAVAMFSESLFAEMLYTQAMNQGNNFISWYMVFQQASWQLLLLGLAILVLTLVVRPDGNGAPGRPSVPAALWTGAVLACAGVWTWFAPQAFPLAEGRTVELLESQSYAVQAWTYVVGQAGGPLLTVGAGALFWALLILATTRRGPGEPVPEDSLEPVSISVGNPGQHHP